MERKPIDIIFAIDENGGYGVYKDDKFLLPWNISLDVKHFKDTTTYHEKPSNINAIIMGKNTWETANGKLIPNRINIVISKSISDKKSDCLIFSTLNDAIEKLNEQKDIETIFIIGGINLILEALNHQDIRYLYLTKIHYNCNANISTDFDFMEKVKKIIWVDKINTINKSTGQYVNITFGKYDCSKIKEFEI
jgi:dihydrofolate reductase